MTEAKNSYIDPETWKAITGIIRRYPRMYIDLVDGDDAIIHGTPQRETIRGGGHYSDPTASKAIKLSSEKRRELNRRCEAINFCLSALHPKHRRVVCLRFWGVERTTDAFALIRELVKQYPDYVFLSPIHALGFLYNDLTYERGIEHCLTLLDLCDEAWFFGDLSKSKGCLIERDYCERCKMPVVDMEKPAG